MPHIFFLSFLLYFIFCLDFDFLRSVNVYCEWSNTKISSEE